MFLERWIIWTWSMNFRKTLVFSTFFHLKVWIDKSFFFITKKMLFFQLKAEKKSSTLYVYNFRIFNSFVQCCKAKQRTQNYTEDWKSSIKFQISWLRLKDVLILNVVQMAYCIKCNNAKQMPFLLKRQHDELSECQHF